MWENYLLCGVCAIGLAIAAMTVLRRNAGLWRATVALGYLGLGVNLLGVGYYGWFVVDNALAGCFPWAPKVVDYYPGMTLCPGQEAVFTGRIIIPLPLMPRVPAAGERGI